MGINYPENPKELEQKSKADVQRELPESNPFLKNGMLGALITGNSFRVYDFYLQLNELQKQLFVQTATGEFLAMFGSWFGVTQNPAAQADGFIVVTGTATTIIPDATQFQSTDNNQYISIGSETITTTALNVLSITRSGDEATVTTDGDHELSSFISVLMAGANETDYNGTFEITVNGTDTFTYTVSGSPATPATGTITATATTAYVNVQSVDYGQSTNQDADSPLTLSTGIAGVDSTTRVDFNGLSGGSDIESDNDYRIRVIERVQNPVAMFNTYAIINQAKTVTGVTRVFVQEVTPAAGQVTIYFVRDNDASIIPDAGEIADVKTAVLEIKPAHTLDADVIVDAPDPITVDFTFNQLSPNTTSMQTAIETNLGELFRVSEVGVLITEDQYRATITKTVDRETGDTVQSFALVTPGDDITINSDEIALLGNVTFT